MSETDRAPGERYLAAYDAGPLNFKRADRGPQDMKWRRTLRRRARRRERRLRNAAAVPLLRPRIVNAKGEP